MAQPLKLGCSPRKDPIDGWAKLTISRRNKDDAKEALVDLNFGKVWHKPGKIINRPGSSVRIDRQKEISSGVCNLQIQLNGDRKKIRYSTIANVLIHPALAAYTQPEHEAEKQLIVAKVQEAFIHSLTTGFPYDVFPVVG